MKLSLLDIVQSILNEMDSDAVNSIDDTVESQQVAQIVKDCYYGLIANRNWPHLRKLVQLEASNQLNKPNYLKIPNNTKQLEMVKYDCRKVGETAPKYTDITYKYPDEFLRRVNSRNGDNDNVQTVIDFSGVSLLILNDVAPTIWTSFDDNYIVMDSYNSAVDDTLKKSKTQAMAYIETEWIHLDSAVPNLPDEAFTALLEEAKSTSFLALKQMANQKSEQKAGKQQRWLARKAWKAKGGVRYEDFGRKSRR